MVNHSGEEFDLLVMDDLVLSDDDLPLPNSLDHTAGRGMGSGGMGMKGLWVGGTTVMKGVQMAGTNVPIPSLICNVPVEEVPKRVLEPSNNPEGQDIQKKDGPPKKRAQTGGKPTPAKPTRSSACTNAPGLSIP
ncbi:uncharacterized protein LACBIDRAFT_331894 [Laccaria bicolor S238N-H82]|uniref:Predicted protein n=1 Tax=Laccaria bicolor (strain S238N-H82 / ATCC MYA-4686) TaxID=486041 RepID=B0DQY6_LACBS|nr:uncharacterized protein LACBIDRAFT_331894 [Laccaria bicolor S238N-H82]EDR02906.1 predicted protein [Laccaria bicolor S238N-H82]|eukprot:XP_001886329.1 predicted protein [Laccaria bicolor S238N-H82]